MIGRLWSLRKLFRRIIALNRECAVEFERCLRDARTLSAGDLDDLEAHRKEVRRSTFAKLLPTHRLAEDDQFLLRLLFVSRAPMPELRIDHGQCLWHTVGSELDYAKDGCCILDSGRLTTASIRNSIELHPAQQHLSHRKGTI